MDDLKSWREANGRMSQIELAKLVGTTQPHLSAIENGEEGVSLELAARIFRVTGITVGKLQTVPPDQIEAVVSFAEAAQ
jgi:transcriptional regulator with XRE-family HTH domain